MNKVRPWLEAAGLSLLYFLPPLAILLSPSHRFSYHELLPAVTLSRGLGIDLILFSLLGGLYFRELRHATGRRRDLFWVPVLCILAWIISRDTTFWIGNLFLRTRIQALVPVIALATLALALAATRLHLQAYRHFTTGVRVLLAGAGLAFLFVVLPRVVLGCFSSIPKEAASFNHLAGGTGMVRSASPAGVRIVWLLFDELSYNQLYDHRAAGVALPAFDQLAQQSVSFAALKPEGIWTEEVIPSLLLGSQIEGIRVNAAGQLKWQSSPAGPWQSFEPQQTIFADARRLGWTTGVAGWFNPYCRLLSPVLDRCYWTYSGTLADGLFDNLTGRQSSLQNAFFGLPFADRLRPDGPALAHLADAKAIIAQGASMVDDSWIRFAFIHLPIPHPPSVTRRPGMPATHRSSYLDSLVLADQALAQLRAAIAASPDANSTVLLVSSDHSWRTAFWRGGHDWTAEDESASHGGTFDQRPVLVVHYPGQTDGVSIHTPADELVVHSLLEDLLAGRIKNEADLKSMLQNAK